MKKFLYRVESGDTVYAVANKLKVPVCTLIKLNNLKKEITAGDLLYIESSDKTYRVKLFDTLLSVAKKFNLTENELKEKNGIEYIYYGQEINI